jgi:hypothetical protein
MEWIALPLALIAVIVARYAYVLRSNTINALKNADWALRIANRAEGSAIEAHQKLDEARISMAELIEELKKKGPDVFPEGEYHSEADPVSNVGLDPDHTLILGDPRNLRRMGGQNNW